MAEEKTRNNYKNDFANKFRELKFEETGTLKSTIDSVEKKCEPLLEFSRNQNKMALTNRDNTDIDEQDETR